jgi:hypothetical protein
MQLSPMLGMIQIHHSIIPLFHYSWLDKKNFIFLLTKQKYYCILIVLYLYITVN